MKNFKISVKYVFSGTIDITADNKEEAERIFQEQVGVTFGEINTTNDKQVKTWDFLIHPDEEIIEKVSEILPSMIPITETEDYESVGFERVFWKDVEKGQVVYLPGKKDNELVAYGPKYVENIEKRMLRDEENKIFPLPLEELLLISPKENFNLREIKKD